MIPLRDTRTSDSFPVATYILMGINLVVFLFQQQSIFKDETFFYLFGLVPAKYTIDEFSQYFSIANKFMSIFSYMFLHGGFMHFVGNIWTLYIFGDNVEQYFGSVRFTGFYIACGAISGIFHCFLNPISMVPTIGASGAIAGVMGAYFLLFPRSRIFTLIPIIIIPLFVEIPAFVFLGLWFVFQFLNATGSGLTAGAGAGIAWWAHVGGFVAGYVLVRLNEKLPESTTRKKIIRFTAKKKTPRLQMVVASSMPGSPDLFGNIEITSIEAITGTKKLITIPWGFYKPLYRVTVPSGVKQGTRLMLSGMGRTTENGSKGNMYLTVNIKNAI